VWRYSRIDQLDLDRFRPTGTDASPSSPDGPGPSPSDRVRSLVTSLGPNAGLMITIDGGAGATVASSVPEDVIALAGSPNGTTPPTLLGSVVGGPEGVPPVERRLRRRSPGDRNRRGRLGHRAGGGGARGGRSRRERRVPADGHPFRPGVEGRRHRIVVDVRRRTAWPACLHLVAHATGGGTPTRTGHLVVPVSEIDVATDAELSYRHHPGARPPDLAAGPPGQLDRSRCTLDSFAVALGGSYARLAHRLGSARRIGYEPAARRPSSAGTTRCSTSGPSRTTAHPARPVTSCSWGAVADRAHSV